MENGKKKPHSNHKKRMRERFIANSDFSGFAEHEIIELLLNFPIVRKNTNDIAHELCERFGSLDGILNADFEELMSVKGISECTATFIKMQYSLLRYYNSQHQKPFTDKKELCAEVIRRLMPRFAKQGKEYMYMITLDSRGNIRKERNLSEGTSGSVSISTRAIIESAIHDHAEGIFLAHNHPNGLIYPSQEDINFTISTRDALRMVNVELIEHFIMGDNEYYPILKNRKDYKAFR